MFLGLWTLGLVALMAVSWALVSRPRRVSAHIRRHERVLSAWSSVATGRGLKMSRAPRVIGSALAGDWQGRALTVAARDGGGWGAEKEYVTATRLRLSVPTSPGLSVWRVGRPLPPGASAPTRHGALMIMGPADELGADSLDALAAASALLPSLRLHEGALELEEWGLSPELGGRLDALSALADTIEAGVLAPWRMVAAQSGMDITTRADAITLRSSPQGGSLQVTIDAAAVHVRYARPLPGVRWIARRQSGQAPASVGNPIADQFLVVDADEGARTALRAAAVTAMAMEATHGSVAAHVDASGVTAQLPERRPEAVGAWCELVVALAHALSPVPDAPAKTAALAQEKRTSSQKR